MDERWQRAVNHETRRPEKAAGDARRIATLPGAAARAPNKQDSDIRPRGAAIKVRMPFCQTSNATLKAAFAVGEQPMIVARGNEQTNHRHTTGANSFSIRLVTTTGGCRHRLPASRTG
jgi:hypothetical protein